MTVITDSARNTLVRDIPIDRIHPSSFNPRRAFEAEALAELAASIVQHGLIEPIVVRPHPAPDTVAGSDSWVAEHFEIIAGERRWRAAKQAGLETIPAMVRDVDDATAIQLAVIENLQRQDLDPIDEAHGFQLLLERAGMTQREAAAALNRSQPAIANALRLLKLPEKVQKYLQDGTLSRAHGVALMRWDGFPDVQVELAKAAVRRTMSTKALEKAFDDWEVGDSLVKAGVVRSVGYSTTFDTEVCKACPFNAYRKAGYRHFCLKPEHYDELEAAAVEAQQREREQALAEATADGAELPSIRTLSGYEDLRYYVDADYAWATLPSGCSEECPCRQQALGYNGKEIIPLCRDPSRFAQLKKQDEERERERDAAMLKARTAQLELFVDHMTGLSTGLLALIAAQALTDVNGPSVIVAAMERQGLDVPEGLREADRSSRWWFRDHIEELSKLSQDQIAKLTLEALIRDELRGRYASSYSSKSPLADFYLGPEPEIEEEDA